MRTKADGMTKAERIRFARLRQLRDFVPEVFQPGTLLYVGAGILRAEFLRQLMLAGRKATVLEADATNVAYHRLSGQPVIHTDVRDLRNVGKYDAVFWWHGPEHIAKDELPAILAELESRADLVVLGCPWGKYTQDAVGGNPYEIHRSALTPQDFQEWGYETSQLGKPNGRYESNILAVKRQEEKKL